MSLPPFTNIANTAIDPNSPITTELMTAYRDNTEHNFDWVGGSFNPKKDHDHDGDNSSFITPAHMFGDGSLGDVIIAVNTTVSSSAIREYQSLTINAGITYTFDAGLCNLRIRENFVFGAGAILKVRRAGSGGAGSTGSPNPGDTGDAVYNQWWNTGGGGGGSGAFDARSGGGGGAGFEANGGRGGDAGPTPGPGGISHLKGSQAAATNREFLSTSMPLAAFNLPSGGGGGGKGPDPAHAGGDAGGNCIITVGGNVSGAGEIDTSGDDFKTNGGGAAGAGGAGGGGVFVFCDGTYNDVDVTSHGGDGGPTAFGDDGGGGGGGSIYLIAKGGGFSGVTTDVSKGLRGGGGGAPEAADGEDGPTPLTITDDPRRYWI